MNDFKDLIKKYMGRVIPERDGLFYFGELSEPSEQQEPDSISVLLKIDGDYKGYVTQNFKKLFHWVSFCGENERFFFDIFPNKTKIKVEPYQDVKAEPVIYQAVTKEDWVTPYPIELRLDGDYRQHRKNIEDAVQNFKKGEKSELYLPSFLTN